VSAPLASRPLADLGAPVVPLPPQGAHAEQALLGAILVNNAVFHRALHFSEPSRRQIFDAIAEIIERGETANPETVAACLRGRGTLDEIGGAECLERLATSVVTLSGAVARASDYLPAPLVPEEVDLRDFEFMPLDVRRLLQSDTWIEASAEPKLGHVLICLWCEAWHQVPAGSLPDNDTVLARFAMCDLATWQALRPKAMAAWTKCSDGRLYHPVVSEKALEAWERKRDQRGRTKAATEARKRRRQPIDAEGADRHVDVTSSSRRRDEQRNDHRNVHQETVDSRHSDPKGSGANTPPDPLKALFDFGVSVLTGADVPAKNARSLIGKWRKDLGDDAALLRALMDAKERAAVEPVAYVTQAVKGILRVRDSPQGRALL
jgi:DnaB-like helicase N terminal domain/Protein of unknown function (DUF1376)